MIIIMYYVLSARLQAVRCHIHSRTAGPAQLQARLLQVMMIMLLLLMMMNVDYDGYADGDSDDKVIIIVSSFLYISTLTYHHC